MTMRSVLRAPALHFLVAGTLLFGAKAIVEWGPEQSKVRRHGRPDEEVPTAELVERLRT